MTRRLAHTISSRKTSFSEPNEIGQILLARALGINLCNIRNKILPVRLKTIDEGEKGRGGKERREGEKNDNYEGFCVTRERKNEMIPSF